MLLPALLLSLAPAQNTWYVDANNPGPGTGTTDDPYLSIQAAIDAQTTLSGDTVRVRNGVYSEAVVVDGKALRMVAGHGQANVFIQRLDTMDTPCLTVRNVPSPGTLFAGFQFRQPLNATTSGRGVELEAAQLELSRCEFSSFFSAGSSNDGGAIHAGAGTVLGLLGCSIEDCGALSMSRGGAIYFEGNTLTLEGCVLTGNQSRFGAAIWMEGSGGAATLRDSEFLLNGNMGTLLSGGVHGQGLIEDCLFRRNLGQENGAVSGAWDIRGTEFDRNGGSDSGNWASAVHGQPRCSLTDCYVHDHSGASSFLSPSAVIHSDVVDCVFENNRTFVDNDSNFINGAGAISDCVAVDCVFTDNRIDGVTCSTSSPDLCGRGGAAYRSELTGCVLIGNSAPLGGAAAMCEMTNCTLYGNSAGEAAGGLWGGTMANCIAFENGGTPLGGGAAASWSCVEFGAPGTGNIDLDPGFLLSGAGDLRLIGSSPCIDSGDPALTDADGTRRDMGALPFDRTTPQPFCAPGPDSAGCIPVLSAVQQPSVSAPFRFEVHGILATSATLSFLSMGTAQQPSLNGQICIRPSLARGPFGVVTTASSGPCDTTAEFTLLPADLFQAGFAPGDAIFTQVFYRDPGSPVGVALTGALAAVFQP